MIEPFLDRTRIAYFSMEIALTAEIPTYSGGLGILAGDTLRSAADLRLPLVGVTLASRRGYFRQEIDAEGRQIEHDSPWEPAQYTQLLRAQVAVPIAGREVWITGWLYDLKSHLGGNVPVILLDTDLPENHPDDRGITHHLYGGDQTYRLKQEIVLGIGGLRMLQALGFHVRGYHMNEGHSALLAVELLRRFRRYNRRRTDEPGFNLSSVRGLCSFTTHTPVEAGHDRFDWGLVQAMLGDYFPVEDLKPLAGNDHLNMTQLALNLSDFINGVARRHAEVSRQMFSGYEVHAVTNGVHPRTWAAPSFAALFDRHIPGWSYEPELLNRADQIPDAEIWAAHMDAKRRLIERVKSRCGVVLDPERPIIGFARRMTAYKRPDLLFSDIERLRTIARRYPFQLVLGGKAHPRDGPGKQAIEDIHRHIRTLDGVVPSAFVPDYDMTVALDFVAGSDVWLNTPLRPLEASGTSGMKAAFNGVPQLSVLDGWWIEGCIDGVTGWAIGDLQEKHNGSDAESLYQRLERDVLPCYYSERADWVRIMKSAIAKNASYFNSHRMLRRYAIDAYMR